MEKSFLSEETTQNNVENKPQVGDVSLGLGALYCVVSSDKKLFSMLSLHPGVNEHQRTVTKS